MYLVNDEVTKRESEFIESAIYYGKRLHSESFYNVVSVEVRNKFINVCNASTELIINTQSESGLIIKWLVSSQIYCRMTTNEEPLLVMSMCIIDYLQ